LSTTRESYENDARGHVASTCAVKSPRHCLRVDANSNATADARARRVASPRHVAARAPSRASMDAAMATLETARAALRGARGADDGDRAIELAGEALEKFVEMANDADADEASVRRETARAHFVYGEALFRGAQARNTVFGERVRANAEASGTRLEDAPEDEDVGEEDEEEEGGATEGERNGEEAADGDEEEDEEESDMELAWKMLETARVMFEEDADAA